jgi:hypothetical protein
MSSLWCYFFCAIVVCSEGPCGAMWAHEGPQEVVGGCKGLWKAGRSCIGLGGAWRIWEGPWGPQDAGGYKWLQGPWWNTLAAGDH